MILGEAKQTDGICDRKCASSANEGQRKTEQAALQKRNERQRKTVKRQRLAASKCRPHNTAVSPARTDRTEQNRGAHGRIVGLLNAAGGGEIGTPRSEHCRNVAKGRGQNSCCTLTVAGDVDVGDVAPEAPAPAAGLEVNPADGPTPAGQNRDTQTTNNACDISSSPRTGCCWPLRF